MFATKNTTNLRLDISQVIHSFIKIRDKVLALFKNSWETDLETFS